MVGSTTSKWYTLFTIFHYSLTPTYHIDHDGTQTRTFLFDIFIEDDVPGIFHKLTSRECTIECVSDRGVVTKVIWTKNLFESISDHHKREKDRLHLTNMNGGFLCMVERHLREKVMADMSIDNVMESMVKNRSKGAINSAQCTTQPVPFFTPEMWHEDISVL